jgi:predicted GH43/DUF377 family glycosyl hydrolase
MLRRVVLFPYGWLLYNRVQLKQKYPRAASLNRIIVPDHAKFTAAADAHFNPTIEFIENRWLMVYRINTPTKEAALAICELDQNFQPKAETNVSLSELISDLPDARRFHSDARFFQYKNRLFISYNNRSVSSEEIRLFLLEISPITLKPIGFPKKLEIAPNTAFGLQTIEKNWQFFSYAEDLYTVYWINPHVILRVKNVFDESRVIYCEPVHITRLPRTFRTRLRQFSARLQWGEPRGGTSPVLVGDTYFSFFHSALNCSRIYSLGLYGFDSKPPFRVKYISKEPIMLPKLEKNYGEMENTYAVVYPCGAVHQHGQWYVSYGVMDRESRIVVLNHGQLVRNCFAC